MGKNFDIDRSETRPSADTADSNTRPPNWFEKLAELADLADLAPLAVPPKVAANSALPEIKVDATPAQIERTISNGTSKLDYAALLSGDRRVIFIGERHDDLAQKDEIINQLHNLKTKGGLTHVALEMLNDADMPAVQKYFEGSGDRQTVLNRLKARWSVAPGVPEKYMDFIDAIKKEKLIPLALDRTRRGGDDHGGSLYEARNEHWAQVVGDALNAFPKAKVLVYSGRDHVGYTASTNETEAHTNEILQKDYGKKSTVVLLASPLDKEGSLSLHVSQAAKAAQPAACTAAFALKISKEQSSRPADFVVLPSPRE
ncbi:MAG: ChaN family lipoprotein [Cyanobacteria bacterium REEB67]|nr:ChaN family lipoprotein [Cyanobacteria bacterium REEB67]